MEKVAMSKMRRAQERMAAARPYAEKLRRTLGHLAQANLEYRHPYITERETKRVAYLVVSTDRGLCGRLTSMPFARRSGRFASGRRKASKPTSFCSATRDRTSVAKGK